MNPKDQITAIPALPNQTGKANVPGLRRLWLIEARQVAGVIDPRKIPGGTLSAWQLPNVDILLKPDAVVNSFGFPAGRGSYEQKASMSVQGVIYTHSLVIEVPRDHPVTALIVRRMTGRKWLAVCQDANGLIKLVGLPKQPLRFLAQLKTNPNAYSFNWVAETREPSWFVNQLSPDLFPVAEFDASFDYSFTS